MIACLKVKTWQEICSWAVSFLMWRRNRLGDAQLMDENIWKQSVIFHGSKTPPLTSTGWDRKSVTLTAFESLLSSCSQGQNQKLIVRNYKIDDNRWYSCFHYLWIGNDNHNNPYVLLLYIYIRISSIDHDHHQSSCSGIPTQLSRAPPRLFSKASKAWLGGALLDGVFHAADLGSINGDTPSSLDGLFMSISWKNHEKPNPKWMIAGVPPF